MPSTPSQPNADIDVEGFTIDLSPANGSFNNWSQILQDVPSTILMQSSAPADRDVDALYSGYEGDNAGDRSWTQSYGDLSSNTYLGNDDAARTVETRQWQSLASCTAQSEQYSEHSPLLPFAPPANSNATGNSSYLSRDNSGALDESKSGGRYGSTVAWRSGRPLQYHGQQSMSMPVDPVCLGNAWGQRRRRSRLHLRRSLGLLARLLLVIGASVVCGCFMIYFFGSIMTRKVKPSGHDLYHLANHLPGPYQRPCNS